MLLAVQAPLRLLTAAVLTSVWLPSVEGLAARRDGNVPNKTHVWFKSEFLPYLKEAKIPKAEFLFPDGREAEEFRGELNEVYQGVAGEERLTNYPETEKGFVDTLEECHIVYRPASREGSTYFNVRKPTVQPLLVARSNPARTDAAVIVAPGGGDKFLAWSAEGYDFAEVLLRMGVNAFILKYRVPTGDTGLPLVDAQRAMSYVRKNAKRFGLNPSRIGFAGFSAGGILTTDLSTSTRRAYARIDDVDDVSYLPDFAIVGYGSGPGVIKPGMNPPPTFTVHAMNDPCVPVDGSLGYCAALKAHGQICDGHYYPEGGHGYSVCLGDKVSAPGRQFVNFEWTDGKICEWPVFMERFLRKVVLGEKDAAKMVLPHFLHRIREARILDRKKIAPEDRHLDMRTLPRQ